MNGIKRALIHSFSTRFVEYLLRIFLPRSITIDWLIVANYRKIFRSFNRRATCFSSCQSTWTINDWLSKKSTGWKKYIEWFFYSSMSKWRWTSNSSLFSQSHGNDSSQWKTKFPLVICISTVNFTQYPRSVILKLSYKRTIEKFF